MPKLTIISGDQKGRTFDLAWEQITIGRDNSNTIPLQGQKISRYHVLIEPDDEGWFLTDLGSRNGTYVNADHIKTCHLKSKDELRIGDIRFLFIAEDESEILFGETENPEDRQKILEETTFGDPSKIFIKPSAEQAPPDTQYVNTQLRALLELTRQVGTVHNLTELMDGIQKAANTCVAPDRVVPMMVNEDGKLRPYKLGRSDFDQDLSKFPISKTIVEHSRKNKVAVLSRDAEEDERFQSAASISLHKIVTAMCVPVIYRDRILGLLYVDRLGQADHFTRDDLDSLSAIGMCLAAPLLNISAYQKVTQEKRILQKELQLQYRLVGQSEPMKAIYNFIERVSQSEASVLITGESGTGKELVARDIHYSSRRMGCALEIVNCAALNHTLMDSEIFGHAKGAFTDARDNRPGRFELADKGTIFLDEIGELSEACQAKLLRVLEQGEIRRLGDTKDRKVDIRVIAATNRDLKKEIEKGRFREDLFYRLHILSIHLPPLRDRPGDIELLAEHFLKIISNKCARQTLQFSDDALQALFKYPWPGNVRELRNGIERMVVMSTGSAIDLQDLPSEIRGEKNSPISKSSDPLGTIAEVEKRHIIQVLHHTGGNKKVAANVLGIDRSTLYARLKTYGIRE